MSDENRRKQLIFRANHRGIKEMDILLGGYASCYLMEMSQEQVSAFEALMNESDRDLLSWFTGEVELPGRFDRQLMDAILDFTRLSAKK